MSRRPRSDSELSQTHGYFNLIAGRPATAPNGSAVRASRLRDQLDEPSTGVRKKPTGPRNYRRSLDDAREYAGQIVKGLWEAASPQHLVGLYSVLHEHVYGVPPLELQQDFGAACSSAGKLVRDEFGGDFVAAQRFVAWCWSRESRRYKRSLKDEREVSRAGWRLQFKSRVWLTDFKADDHRRAG